MSSRYWDKSNYKMKMVDGAIGGVLSVVSFSTCKNHQRDDANIDHSSWCAIVNMGMDV